MPGTMRIETHMRAARFHEYGSSEVITVEEAPEPHAPAGAVRIRTSAASVNPIDVLLRSGIARALLPLALPATPGRDAAGFVDEIGEGVTGVGIGDAVFGLGGYADTTAEFSVLTAWATVPSTWSMEQAAAAGLASTTAVAGLDPLGDLNGKTLLIDGAAGAVGAAAGAIALSHGARVIGTASPHNHAFLRGIGVIPTTYGDGLADRVAALAPGGVDAALDAAGAGSLDELVRITGDTNRVTTVADGAGAARLGVRQVNATNASANLEIAAQLGSIGSYLPRVEHVFPLEKTAEAHALVQDKRARGKVVISIGQARLDG
jgi:NADPH:quinone reductase-like Zn-dependent oxidoreductase